MSDIHYNPFLEGSEEVSDQEVLAAAKALAEEAAAVRAKTSEIKEKAARARVEKETARKLEQSRIEAEIEAARAQVVKTVASIPKASDRPTIRPAPPKNLETFALGEATSSGAGKFYLTNSPAGILSIVLDAVVAAIVVTFTFLIFQDMHL